MGAAVAPEVVVADLPRRNWSKKGGCRSYRRTTGGKHRWKRLMYMPVVRGNEAVFPKTGTRYRMDDDGWRRMPDVVIKTGQAA